LTILGSWAAFAHSFGTRSPSSVTDVAFKITYERDSICETPRRFPEEWRIFDVIAVNTFAAIVDHSRFNNSCLRLLKISDDNNE
jgi:hypothetical protein